MATPTSTSSAALHYGIGSKAGYGAGRWWLFYSNATNIVFASTTDATCTPSTFNTPVSTGYSGSDGSYFQVIIEGTYAHFFYCVPDGSPIYYKRGTLGSDGSISWDSAVSVTTGTDLRITSVDIDSDGHLLVAYYDTNYCKVTRNDNTDGTWSTTTGYPKQLTTTISVNYYCKVLAMTSGKWFAMYCGVTGGHIYGRYWNGSTLASEEQCTDIITSATPRWDARAYGDNIYLAWNGQPANFSIYRRSRLSGSWGTTVTLETMGSSDYDKVPAVSVNRSIGDVFIAWQSYPSANHVYYQKYAALTNTWGSITDAVTETALPDTYQMVGLSEAQGDCMLFFYQSGSSPYALDNIYLASPTGGTYSGGPTAGIMCGGFLML